MCSRLLCASIALVILLCSSSSALERRDLANVDFGALVGQLNKGVLDSGTNAIVNYYPPEYWVVTMAKNDISSTQKDAIIAAMKDVSILSIAVFDVGSFGVFKFYNEEEISKGLIVDFVSIDGDTTQIDPLYEIDVETQVLLDAMKPMLAANMGKLGEHMSFFVFPNTTESGHKIVDPFERGVLTVRFVDSRNRVLDGQFEFPLDALYVPRKCPNGKDAHVSWKYCPWTGEKLPD